MPRKQTDLFTGLTSKQGKEVRLKPDDVRAGLSNDGISYEQMSDLLRETNDAQFGIVSTLQDNTWLRDATAAIPLDQRISRNAPVIDANNTLLRCLSRLRPIDFAIEQKMEAKGAIIRAELKDAFSKLAHGILTIAQDDKMTDAEKQKAIAKQEKDFNTLLVKKLHAANLAKGCASEEDAEKLLFHYRNLSSVLSPARTMVTLTYDAKAKVLQRDTQYPVTKKTPEQRVELAKLKDVVPHASKAERNSHTAHKEAMQEADSLFADRISLDDRALGAQARKTHLVGAKNAFIVKTELIKVDSLPAPDVVNRLSADDGDVLWLARMGSPAFVGKGEPSAVVLEHSKANLEQVRRAAAEHMGKPQDAEMYLHVTTLNTVSPLEKQSTIVDNVYKATQAVAGDMVSYVPTNPDGTFRMLDIAPGLNFTGVEAPRGSAPLQKATRLASVSKVMLAASERADTVSVVHCASGQDRTGTAVEKATQDWMAKRYAAKGLDASNIETMRAEGGNAAEITTHHIHGSPGMKTDSLANNFFGSQRTFGERATEEMYLESAKTNKRNKVANVAFLSIPNNQALDEYAVALNAFNTRLEQGHPRNQDTLYAKGSDLLRKIEVISGGEPKQLKSNELYDLTAVLKCADKGLKEAGDKIKTTENAKELANLSHKVSGKSSSKWKALGIGLLTFACAVLVVVGVLAAIPTGGASLLAAVAGAAGLAATAGTAAAVGGAAVAGTAAVVRGSEKGLASSVTDFKCALTGIKRPEERIELNKGKDSDLMNPC